VIAYGKGGALETVIEGETGLFFRDQTPEALIQAVDTFENKNEWDSYAIRRHAEGFSKERFKEEIQTFIKEKTAQFFEAS